LGRTPQDRDEPSTVLWKCESMMNNRQITYVSEEVKDLTPFTPAMFMHEIRKSGVPDLDKLDESSTNRRLVYRQKLKQDL
ncbi:integrase catalytic domain-containing protein, partial [Nephila pilipes]